MTRSYLLVPAVVAALAIATPARADRSDTEVANQRFEEGRVLAERGEWAKACPKFAESEKIQPSGRAIFNLGDCYEHLGKFASALREFEEALRRARAVKKQELIDVTLRRVTAASAKVSRLVLDGRETADKVAIKIDGELMVLDAIGPEGIAVDPGEHVITASAPGKKTWTKSLFFGDERSTQNVVVPPLENAAGATDGGGGTNKGGGAKTRDDGGSHKPSSGGVPWRTVGIAGGATGVVAAGIGIALGLAASSRLDHVRAVCPNGVCPNDAARAQGDSDLSAARDLAGPSTACIIGGAVVAAAGFTLAIVNPSSSSVTGSASVSVRASVDRVLLEGHF